MKYGKELIEELEREIKLYEETMSRRWDRINNGETDQEDCFVSMRVEERGRDLAKDKIKLIKDGGCDWFVEYATLDGVLVNAKWCRCKSYTGYGHTSKLRIEMPDGTVKWTQATTEKRTGTHRNKARIVQASSMVQIQFWWIGHVRSIYRAVRHVSF